MTTMEESLSHRALEFSLASVLASYPGDELAGVVGDLEAALHDHPAMAPVRRLIAEGGLDALRGRYVERFDRAGARASPYETEYGRMRGMSKGHDLADVAGFYRAFGFDLDRTREHELVDHVAVELEFYALLLLKQDWLAAQGETEGVFIVEDARRKFLKDHLGSFVTALAARPEVATDDVYGPVFQWCSSLVGAECKALGVTPAPLDFFPDTASSDDMACGAVRLPVVE